MKRSGYADLPLHYGRVPAWLYERMAKLGRAVIECIIEEYGKSEVLRRLSDPMWFQSLGCVMGMDWHSSGITTSVMGALKKSINPISKELGIYICGGRGKHSRKTPDEIRDISNSISLDGDELIKCSRLSAKIDNTAIQDGFQIYLHSFVMTDEGKWAVVQQGLNDSSGFARRYHWHSEDIKSFIEEPHSYIYGRNQGEILNLVDKNAGKSRKGIIDISNEPPDLIIPEIQKILMPANHQVREKDVNLKRLGSVLAVAYEKQFQDFESLLLLKGIGPRTIQSLALVSEVIYGTPTRFTDPARFSFAHGGKDGHPHPVLTEVYDETIEFLEKSIKKAKIDNNEKNTALKKLVEFVEDIERKHDPSVGLEKLINKENDEAYKYSGRTVFGFSKKRKKVENKDDGQLFLFKD